MTVNPRRIRRYQETKSHCWVVASPNPLDWTPEAEDERAKKWPGNKMGPAEYSDVNIRIAVGNNVRMNLELHDQNLPHDSVIHSFRSYICHKNTD